MRADVTLRGRLESRREEIEDALLVRVYGVADPGEVGDLEYVEGLREAASAALDLALATLERPERPSAVLPAALASQARLAARNGVGLDTVIRRYSAGHTLFVDFLIAEWADDADVPPDALRPLLAALSATFDRLLTSVTGEYTRELESRARASQDRRRVELVERLIAGEVVDPSGLAYSLGGWHIGFVLDRGERPRLKDLARALDRQLLVVEPQPQLLWAWLGGFRRIETVEVLECARACLGRARVGLGEPAVGLAGWRLSHKQAKRVLPVARGEKLAIARYAELGLLASVHRDQVLTESLRELYLDPLRDGGEDDNALCETLRAYFAAGCNISSAASALAVHRQTVSGRLRNVEERLDRPLPQCTAELIVALALQPVHATARSN
jgi:hypothetical protein